MKIFASIAAVTLVFGLTAGSAGAVEYQYHDENTTQHVGRTTVPAMGGMASRPAVSGTHDENTTQHVGRTTSPAMSAVAGVQARMDQHDENTSVHVRSRN